MNAPDNTAEDAVYTAARTTAVWIERSDRALVRMHGRDPVRMIQGLVTNEVANAPADRAVYAALLTPKGKMLADLRIFRHGDDVLLECAAGARANVTDVLTKFVPPLYARWELLDDLCVFGVYGPAASETVATATGETVPADSAPHTIVRAETVEGDAFMVRTFEAGVGGWDVIAAQPAIDVLRGRLVESGVTALDPATLDVLRIEAGVPAWGAELTEATIPLEAGLRESAISEGKGCYTGQEVIVRILHRGHVNWNLRGMLLGDVSPPPPDTALIDPAEGRKLGRITSACASPALGQTIALGYARRELTLPATLKLGRLDGPDITVVALPFEH